ncbi:MAG: cytochrome b/b6 domain-containing protein [Nitrospiraceae bacterium]
MTAGTNVESNAMLSRRHGPIVDDPLPSSTPPLQHAKIYRHSLPVRLSHWMNVACLFVLIMSGLQIFNAHPALYWGDRSDRDKPWISMRAMKLDSGEIRGVTTVAGHAFDTTGWLGYADGMRQGFPNWATLPSQRWLAMGRQWHLFFAWLFVFNGMLYAVYTLVSRHAVRHLLPTGQDLAHIPQSIVDHVRLRHPSGEAATRYNPLQKIAYCIVLGGLAPLIVLTGVLMSPTIDAAAPWLLSAVGGRQSARTLHFIACFAFIGFIAVHVGQVILTGFVNNLRSMLTGWFTVTDGGKRS